MNKLPEPTVAVIILNYNSEDDLMISAPQLAAQAGVQHSLILVDNASRPESVGRIKTWLADWRPDAVVGSQEEVHTWVENNHDNARAGSLVYFIAHNENKGYSAGNNVGIRLAHRLGSDAVLIANPDMRISEPNYISRLAQNLFRSSSYLASSSRILDLKGEELNPQKESSFIEEVFWPYQKIKYKLTKKKLQFNSPPDGVTEVAKLAGCCIMLRTKFLIENGLLDEGVFLFSEEAILAKKISANHGSMIYDPTLKALHAHKDADVISQCKSSALFISSRLYYINKYTNYSYLQKYIIRLSYDAMRIYFWLKMMAYKYFRQ